MRTNDFTIWSLFLFFLITGICLSFLGCDNDKVIHEHFGYVEGTVIDILTRLPIDSAWIRISTDTLIPPNTYTNSVGYYFFERVTGTNRFHYCGKSGYVTKKTEEYRVNINKTTRVNIELFP